MIGLKRFVVLLRRGFKPSDIPQAEADTLIDLYNATDGDNWTTNTNWLVDPVVNNWYGVTVAGGHVTQINLGPNNLDGEIPSSLGNLSNLTKIYLQNNSLSGSMPAELGNLSNLTYLNLNTNQLSGSIPAELGNLGDLEKLYLHINQLSGSIPPELGNLSNLTRLYLHGNQLSGVEAGALDLPKIVDLRLYDNGMDQAAVNFIISEIHDYRDSYTDATPELQIDGDNSAPTGTVQDVCPPTTPAEELYNLAHAQCVGDTHVTWSITYNGGSEP